MARPKKKREIQEINASSMADIAFLLLVFFLVTTTFDSDYGLQRSLPPKPSEEVEPIDINKRNVFVILINRNDEMYVNGEVGDINLLREEIKNFIINPANEDKLSSKKQIFSEKWGKEILISKGVVALQTDRNTSYKKYIEVQNVLAGAFNDLKNELSSREFRSTYDELKELASKGDEKAKKQMEAVDEAIPLSIAESSPKKTI